MILISACLAGIDCAWDGKNRMAPEAKKLLDEGKAIAACPEVLGGRAVPRTRTEIQGGSGKDVIEGKAKVLDEKCQDVTGEFLKGAQETLSIVRKYKIKKAILKSKSPSCGTGKIYDGTFKGNLVPGDGVTTALLKEHGVECSGL